MVYILKRSTLCVEIMGITPNPQEIGVHQGWRNLGGMQEESSYVVRSQR